MKIIDIVRLEDSREGTFGALLIDQRVFCCTLEPPNLGNRKNVSNIPQGAYVCERVDSPKYGDTFEVTRVMGRSHILFHAGNFVEDTKGCILLGRKWGTLKGDRAVLNSGATFDEFMRKLRGLDQFYLIIKDPPQMQKQYSGEGVEF